MKPFESLFNIMYAEQLFMPWTDTPAATIKYPVQRFCHACEKKFLFEAGCKEPRSIFVVCPHCGAARTIVFAGVTVKTEGAVRAAKRLTAEAIRKLHHATPAYYNNPAQGNLEFTAPSLSKAKLSRPDSALRLMAKDVLDLLHDLKRKINAIQGD